MRSPRVSRCPQPAVPIMYAENYERVPESAGAARRLVVRALETWQLAQLADTATLVVTELVSNAVRHACGDGMRVTVLRMSDRRVRVSVTDRDPARPRVQDQDPQQERGRGLIIVAAESERWGVELLPGGKQVWSELVAP